MGDACECELGYARSELLGISIVIECGKVPVSGVVVTNDISDAAQHTHTPRPLNISR